MANAKMRTCLWFDHGKAREAAEFYASVFPDSRVEGAHDAPSDYPDGKKGNELTVEFTVLGQPFLGLNGGPNFKPNESVSFQIYTEDQAETDRYWNAIVGNGGRESECGWCKDRWGFSWQITPRADGGHGRSRPGCRQARHGRDDDDAEDRNRKDRGGASTQVACVRTCVKRSSAAVGRTGCAREPASAHAA